MNARKFLYGALSLTLALSPMTYVMATDTTTLTSASINLDATYIALSDTSITIDGEAISSDTSEGIYLSNDIIYYEDRDSYDSGNPYGEGTASEKHSAAEAAKHTVVNITQPGTYRISGQLSYGQIFVNVGKDEADKVTLILDDVDINCTVAPAIFFYKVYECDPSATTETASNSVDTSNAGARVIIADDSVNHITGSHVARIYKDNTDQKKLHKYDGAFYSRMSMEIDGETKGNGVLNITADNEGLDTELHLTINGGVINIQSGDDGINVNEDGISVFTMNDGYLGIYAGNGAEGDGIDSNGWIVINGGTILSLANPNNMDGGIDSDMGSTINGGTVIGAGNMYDPLEEDSNQLFMFLELAEKTDALIVVTNDKDEPIFAYDFPHNYTYISFSTPTLTEGTYHVYTGGTITGIEKDGYYSQITSYTGGTLLYHGGTSSNNQGGFGNRPSGNGTNPEDFITGERPTKPDSSDKGAPFEGNLDSNPPTLPEGFESGLIPEGFEQGTRPEGISNGGNPHGMQSSGDTASSDFILTATSRGFTNVSANPSTIINSATSQFTDVASNSTYASAIAFCQQSGLMTGTSDTTFSPSAPVTREMFATILYRLANTPSVTSNNTFNDVSNSASYYYDAVNWASQQGITVGIHSTTFGVGQSISLQDAITMLQRLGQGNDLTGLNSAQSMQAATRAEIASLLMQYCR